jgi:hypothetical protein
MTEPGVPDMIEASSRLWERWKGIADIIGIFQPRVLLTLFYYLILAPFALGMRLFADPSQLRRQNRSHELRGARPTAVMDRRHDVERVSRRWIVRLRAAVVLLSLVLTTCAYPEAAGSGRPGLGVSRAAMEAVFAHSAFAFRFEAPHKHQGIPRVTGTVPGKLIVLNLVGPPEDLTEITLIVGVPSTNPLAPPAAPKVLAENKRYLRAVLQQAMPDWKDGVKRLNTELQRSAERLEVGLRKGHREIVLLAVNHLSMVLLSIRAGQPPATRGP